MMENGVCVAAPGYEFVGTNSWVNPNDKSNFLPCFNGEVMNNKRKCVPPGSPLWK